MKLARFCVLLALTIVATPAPFDAAAQQPARVLTPEVIMTIAQVADAQISPDGLQVAYQVSRPRTASDPPGAAKSELWVASTAGGTPRRLTQDDDRSPRWSPDGHSVAFLGRRGSDTATQIYVVNPSATGDVRPVTSAPSSVTSFRWAPNGQWIGGIL